MPAGVAAKLVQTRDGGGEGVKDHASAMLCCVPKAVIVLGVL
jgi:hypothetical protein